MVKCTHMDTSITPENLEEQKNKLRRQALLLSPHEHSEVDYKAGVAFIKGEDFSFKIVKQILGMANAGGGFLVIGYPENTGGQPEAGTVSTEVLNSYDVSTVASTVEKYKIGTEKISLKVIQEVHPTNGQVYPIIEIGSFKSRPFFSKSTIHSTVDKSKKILEENVLYIRVAGARTIKVAAPDEWDQLIDLCVQNKQAETLHRFSELMKEFGLPASGTTADSSLKKNSNAWIEEEREQAKAEAKKAGFGFEGMEIVHSIDSDKTWNIKDLLEGMKASALKNTGWPIGFVFHVPEYKPQPYKKGIRSIIAPDGKESFDYWSLSEDGDFYFFRAYQEDSYKGDDEEKKRQLWFDTQIWRIAEALEHTTELYKVLGVNGITKVNLSIRFVGINHRDLKTSPSSSRLLFPHKSGSEDVYEWSKIISIDGLNTTIDQNVVEISSGLFLLFEFTEISAPVIEGVIKEYRGLPTSV